MMKLNLFATKLEENHTYIMKNIVKRITAMGAAVMMMSSMAIGASAANSYNLHYTKGAPSSDNVCEKWMYGIKAQNNGYLKSTCKSINTSGKFSVLANGYRSSSHTINCGSFDIWNKGTTNWKNSNYKKGYSYDVVAEFGVSGGYTNISKYVSSASSSGSFN